jgi:hypothetical protein
MSLPKPHVFSNSKKRHMPICESTPITCSTGIKKAKLSPRALFPNDETIEPIAIYTAERLAPEEQIFTLNGTKCIEGTIDE